MVPITGGGGIEGCSGIITFADIPDTHPAALVRVKL